MSDEEWQHWQATYARGARPLPPVMKRARTDRRRALLGMAMIYVISAFLLAPAIRELARAHTAPALASPLFTFVFLAVLIGGAQVAMRGTLGRSGGAPLDLLADLERRHAGRRRLIRFMPWLMVFAVGGTVAVVAAPMIAAGHVDAGDALATIVACAVTIWFARRTMTRVGALIDRELHEAAEARRLLAEDEGSHA
jgi:hypothetical protein